MNVFITFQVSPHNFYPSQVSPDVNLLAGWESRGPEARDLPWDVGVSHVVGQTQNLHVKCLLQPTVKARVTNHPEPDESLICDVAVVGRLRHSYEHNIYLYFINDNILIYVF